MRLRVTKVVTAAHRHAQLVAMTALVALVDLPLQMEMVIQTAGKYNSAIFRSLQPLNTVLVALPRTTADRLKMTVQ